MREMFVPKEFSFAHSAVIRQANNIIAEYDAAGFTLTLRQLYYQFVARDMLPNNQQSYKRLGDIINAARLAGRIDWSAIEDRTRSLRDYASYTSPEAALNRLARQYIEDLWENQPVKVEVWIEKDALVGVVEPVCGRWRLPHFACRGYGSQSELYKAGKRMERHVQHGCRVVVLHLGDHDPSGIDMTRDNRDRLHMFSQCFHEDVEIVRLALNMEQIEQYNPPPNPAKETDSRHRDYVASYGTTSSWELDALDPKVIDGLIDDAVVQYVDPDIWARAKKEEDDNRKLLLDVALEWPDVRRFLKKWTNRHDR